MSIFSNLGRRWRTLDAAPTPHSDTFGSSLILPGGVVQGGWANPTSGLGIPGQDPTAQLIFHRGTIPGSLLVDKLYTHDWLAARVVEKMPSVAMVRGFGVAGTAAGTAGNSDLLDEYEALNTTERFPNGAFERAVYDGRAHGGSVLLIGYKKGNPMTELTDQQRAGGIAWFDVVAQHELRVLARVQDPNRGDFGMPLLYEVVYFGSGEPHPRLGQKFHASRCIRFSGRPLRTQNTALQLSDTTGAVSHPELGISVLTPLLSVMAHFGLAWASVSNMLQDASIGWMKMAGLVEALASEDKAVVEERMKVLQMTKGSHRLIPLDADNNEEMGRTEVRLTDVPAVLQMFIVLVSGAADVPARIFFGTSPQGLNANSSNDGDLTQLYNTCQDYQKRYLGPKLNTILTAVNGGTPVKVTWPSLWEAGENEQAQTRLARANADNIYWQMGACEASDIVQAAKTGVHPETLGTPDDNRIVLKSTEVGGDPSAPPADPNAAPPQGAPGKQQASKIATKQRTNQSGNGEK